MAWRESCAMDERVKFISEWLRRGVPLRRRPPFKRASDMRSEAVNGHVSEHTCRR